MIGYILNKGQLEATVRSLSGKRLRESEVIELKEAKNDFSFKDMTRYFSALSNEANLRDVRTALLIFGVADSGEVCGTNYRSGSPEKLQGLKREIASKTNQQMTFKEITELDIDGKRVVVFQIPPALNGAPTTWEGVAWGRSGSSLVPLSLDKIDAIRAKPHAEWGREVLERATIEDLDPDAVEQAVQAFRTRFYQARPALLDGLSTYDLLEKMGLTRGGMLTNASLLLLGRSGAEEYLDGPAPCLTWTLYGDGGQAVSYQHYGVPLILNVENVCHRVRNERVFMRSAGSSMVVQPIPQYEWWSMRELLGNAIAHQDYGVSRHIYLHEFPNKLVFLNEGGFIPGSIEAVLREGYRAPRYRNPFLCDALMKLGILDRNTLGIRRVFEAQKNRRMPLPTYDLSDPARVSVTLWGVELDPRYTNVLASVPLDLNEAYVLDCVQKGLPVDSMRADELVGRGLLTKKGDAYEIAEINAGAEMNVGASSSLSKEISSTAWETTREGNETKHASDGLPQMTVPRHGNGGAGRTTLARQDIILDILKNGGMPRREILAELQSRGALGLFGNRPQRTLSLTLKLMREEGALVSEGTTKAAVWMRPSPSGGTDG